MNEIKNLDDLFCHELQVLWSTESLILEAMPGMIERAKDEGLKNILRLHLAETDQHKVALEGICKQLHLSPSGGHSSGLEGILEEGQRAMASDATDEATDAALIATAQKIEHYEIAGYSTAGYYAYMLGHEGIAQRLRLTLTEEQQADTKLGFLAKNIITQRSAQPVEV